METSFDRKMQSRALLVLGVVIACIVSFSLFKQGLLNKKGVFVIGHLLESSFEGTEFGWMHKFEYYYEGKRFIHSFSSPMEDYVMIDSLMFIQFLPEMPFICESISIRVPKCLTMKNVPLSGWNRLPGCP